jgi:hypothetical protein
MSALDALAARAGIEPYYHDIWGGRHALSPETKRIFLDAMGLSAASEEEAAQSLAAFATTPWRRALEPVTVLRAGSPEWAADIVCDAARAGAATWRIVMEDGTRQEGTVSLADLPVAETQRIAGHSSGGGSLCLRRCRLAITASRSPAMRCPAAPTSPC